MKWVDILTENFGQLFGFEYKKVEEPALKSFEIDEDQAATDVVAGSYLYSFNSNLNQTEVELIKTYRSLSIVSDVEFAINEIQNEIFIFDVLNRKAVDIEFIKESEISDQIKKKIRDEFNYLYKILDFKSKGSELFKSWYVDSKLILHKIIDEKSPKDGIKKIQFIDPLKIKFIREIPNPNPDGTFDLSKVKEYYSYNSIDMQGNFKDLIIKKDSICYCSSGLYDSESKCTIGYLWKSIVPYNNMKLMEDALIVYRVTRSPERRVFYIDVGGLPKQRAEEYMKNLMNRFKNKLIFDSRTGTVVDRKNIMSMVEDYWLPRRDGGRGTEIQSLPGSQNVGVIDDDQYFKQKFFKSLNIPLGRIRDDQQSSFVFGKNIEIDREEYRFKKFLDKLRMKFSEIFYDLLKTQLILKNVVTNEDWELIKDQMYLIYAEDNNFVEFKESESLNSRLMGVQTADLFTGKYYTREWVMSNILRMGMDEIKEMFNSIEEENKKFAPPPEENIQ